ncbi:MAG TPA: hypothetical protein VMT27_09425, partial [Actinomycetes bacterium]|nr:hypothetical protein [Actinomycetes bacterium]
FDRVDIKKGPTDYLQTAGGRDRMTVELRRTYPSESFPSHVVLARPNAVAKPYDAMEAIDVERVPRRRHGARSRRRRGCLRRVHRVSPAPDLSKYEQRPL